MSTNYQADSRSLPELIRDLRDESIALVRNEVALAKTEMGEKVASAGRSTVTLITGGAVAHLGLIFLLLAASEGVRLMLVEAGLPFHSAWLAPLIVGAVVGMIGLIMFSGAKKRLSETTVVPEKTIQTLKDDKQWVQEKVR